MGIAAFEFVSPISMLHRGIVFGMGFGWSAIAMIFLFDLFVLKNGWCGHVCPFCARCIEVCDDDALKFSIRDMIQKKKTGE